MWCSTCQHDVQAAASGEPQIVRCEECGATLRGEDPGASEIAALAPAAAPQIPDEDWQIEADLRSVERLIASLRANRIDPPAAIAAPHLSPVATQPGGANPDNPLTVIPRTNLAAWTVLSLGLAVLACGAVLAGWSLVQERDDLWSLGLPLALGGQAAVIVGLILQLEGLWQSNRQTVRTLTVLENEPGRVSRAMLRSTTPSRPGGV